MPPTDLAAERRRLAKKRKVAAEKVDIPSPRAQLERNREAAAASVAENRAREERRNEKKRVQIATREEDHAFLLAQQRAAVEEGAVDRPANERQSRGLVHVARTPAGPRINVSLPRSEYVEEVDYETLRAPFKEQECSNFADVRDFVKAQREVAVLCALPDGNGVRTWNDLQLIDGDERGLNWYSPGHWLTLSRAWTQRSAPWMKRLNESGNYNDVLVLSAGAPLDDPAHWPPQLRPGYDMKPSILRGDGAFVVRMTRTDPFAKGPGDGKSPAKVYRSMKMEALVMEMAHTLHAASLGVGPAVYAAVSWPWDQVPGTGVQRYGLLMVLERAAGDMVHYQDDLLRKHPLGCSINGPPRELREHAECAGAWLAGLCYHVAWSGFINFDVKPSNLLMCQREDTFCMTDFDHMYHRQVTDAKRTPLPPSISDFQFPRKSETGNRTRSPHTLAPFDFRFVPPTGDRCRGRHQGALLCQPAAPVHARARLQQAQLRGLLFQAARRRALAPLEAGRQRAGGLWPGQRVAAERSANEDLKRRQLQPPQAEPHPGPGPAPRDDAVNDGL